MEKLKNEIIILITDTTNYDKLKTICRFIKRLLS